MLKRVLPKLRDAVRGILDSSIFPSSSADAAQWCGKFLARWSDREEKASTLRAVHVDRSPQPPDLPTACGHAVVETLGQTSESLRRLENARHFGQAHEPDSKPAARLPLPRGCSYVRAAALDRLLLGVEQPPSSDHGGRPTIAPGISRQATAPAVPYVTRLDMRLESFRELLAHLHHELKVAPALITIGDSTLQTAQKPSNIEEQRDGGHFSPAEDIFYRHQRVLGIIEDVYGG
jgi:hypothetical protein